MEEKGAQFFEKYELTVLGSTRVRGAFRIDTETGPMLLLPYGGSEARAEFEQALLLHLRERDFLVDDYVRNAEGTLITRDEYGDPFLLKRWYYGEECNLRHQGHVLAAVGNLAHLHNHMRGELRTCEAHQRVEAVDGGEETDEASSKKPVACPSQMGLWQLFDKRNRELRRVRAFLREKRRRSYFENLYINTFPSFFQKAEELSAVARRSSCEETLKRHLKMGTVCHDAYTHHNVLFLEAGIATVNFEGACLGVQISDFVLFFRKLMEKSGWSLGLAEEMVDAYASIRCVEKEEWNYFYLMLAYPEKFWKISNSYFNGKKSFFPQRTTEKLQALLSQEAEKEQVLAWILRKLC